jgi:hypothetical protein
VRHADFAGPLQAKSYFGYSKASELNSSRSNIHLQGRLGIVGLDTEYVPRLRVFECLEQSRQSRPMLTGNALECLPGCGLVVTASNRFDVLGLAFCN